MTVMAHSKHSANIRYFYPSAFAGVELFLQIIFYYNI